MNSETIYKEDLKETIEIDKLYEDYKKVYSMILKECKDKYGEKIYNKIINKISYEILNKDIKDKEMKKFLIGGLVLSLLLGFNGCKHEPDPEPVKKVVDAKYIGEFWDTSFSDGVYKLIVREDEIIFNRNHRIKIDEDLLTHPDMERYPAWTEVKGKFVNLCYQEPGISSPSYFNSFEDENTIGRTVNHWYKRVNSP